MTCSGCPHRIEIPKGDDVCHQSYVAGAMMAIVLEHGGGEHQITLLFPPMPIVRIGPEALAALEEEVADADEV